MQCCYGNGKKISAWLTSQCQVMEALQEDLRSAFAWGTEKQVGHQSYLPTKNYLARIGFIRSEQASDLLIDIAGLEISQLANSQGKGFCSRTVFPSLL